MVYWLSGAACEGPAACILCLRLRSRAAAAAGGGGAAAADGHPAAVAAARLLSSSVDFRQNQKRSSKFKLYTKFRF
jgi:hypothetical protein